MALGDAAEVSQMPAGHQADRQLFAFAGRPEPVERAVRPPARLVRLVERETKTEHARPLAPVLHDLFAVWGLKVEIPEDTELSRVDFDCFDRLHVWPLAKRARRMNDRGVDPG